MTIPSLVSPQIYLNNFGSQWTNSANQGTSPSWSLTSSASQSQEDLNYLNSLVSQLNTNASSLPVQMEIIAFMGTMNQDGTLTNSNIQSVLQQYGFLDSSGNLSSMSQSIILEGAQAVFYNGTYFGPTGFTSLSSQAPSMWLKALNDFFNPPQGNASTCINSPVITQLTDYINSLLNPPVSSSFPMPGVNFVGMPLSYTIPTASTPEVTLSNILSYIHTNPGDMAGQLGLIQYIGTLGKQEILSGNVESLLQMTGLVDANGNATAALSSILERGALYAMFNGYTNSSGALDTGSAAATDYLNAMSTYLNSAGSSPTIQSLQNAINGPNGLLSQVSSLASIYYQSVPGGTGALVLQNPGGGTSTYCFNCSVIDPGTIYNNSYSPTIFNEYGQQTANRQFINNYIATGNFLTSSTGAGSGVNDFFLNMQVPGAAASTAYTQNLMNSLSGYMHIIQNLNTKMSAGGVVYDQQASDFTYYLTLLTEYFNYTPQLGSSYSGTTNQYTAGGANNLGAQMLNNVWSQIANIELDAIHVGHTNAPNSYNAPYVNGYQTGYITLSNFFTGGVAGIGGFTAVVVNDVSYALQHAYGYFGSTIQTGITNLASLIQQAQTTFAANNGRSISAMEMPAPTDSSAPVLPTGTLTAATALSTLQTLIEYLNANPNSLQAKLSLISFISALDSQGFLTNSSTNQPIIQLLQDVGLLDSNGNVGNELSTLLKEGTVSAMFNGYTSMSGINTTGSNAATAWLSDLYASYNSNGNTALAQQMRSLILTYYQNIPTYANTYGFANGGTGSISLSAPNLGTLVYDWAPTGSSATTLQQQVNLSSNQSANQSLIQTFLASLPFSGSGIDSSFSWMLPAGLTAQIPTGATVELNSMPATLLESVMQGIPLGSSTNSATPTTISDLCMAAAYITSLPAQQPVSLQVFNLLETKLLSQPVTFTSGSNTFTSVPLSTVLQNGTDPATGYQFTLTDGVNAINSLSNAANQATLQNVQQALWLSIIYLNNPNPSASQAFPLPDSIGNAGPPNQWPGAKGGYLSGVPYFDQLGNFFQYLQQFPNSLVTKLNFVGYLQTLNANGVLSNSDVTHLLTVAGIIQPNQSVASELQTIIQQGAVYAMFNGYTTSNGTQLSGASAATAWLVDLQHYFLNPNAPISKTIINISSYISQVEGSVPTLATTYGFANGGTGSLKITNSDGSTNTFQWNVPTNASQQQMNRAIINDNIANINTAGSVDSFFNSIDIGAVVKAYRQTTVSDILNTYHDPAMMLCLVAMTLFDTGTQIEIGGLGNTTTLLNYMTTNYATPLLQQAQNFGTFSTPPTSTQVTQAQNFVDYLYGATAVVNSLPQFSSIASTWNQNVLTAVSQIGVNVSVTASNGQTYTLTGVPLSDLFQQTTLTSTSPAGTNSLNTYNANIPTGVSYTFTPTDTATAFKWLAAPDTASSGGSPPGYQGFLAAIQQGGALFTNQSQIVSQQLGTATTNDQAYVKLGSAVASPTGGGFMQLIHSVVQAQTVTS